MDKDNLKISTKLWNFNRKQKEDDKDEKDEKDNVHISISTNGAYLYYFTSQGTLAQIGTGYESTMLGKVYQIREGFFKGEKGSIAVVEDTIYYRSSSLDPSPIVCVNAETLENVSFIYLSISTT